MSENETGWEVVETKPIASTVIPTPEALAARARERRRPHREPGENPFLRRLSPRRSHWPNVTAYDERARELERRAAAVNDEITHREEAFVEAGKADHEALTSCQLGDRKGPRPEPTVPAIEREITAKKADRDAALAACERVYEDQARYVEKHRCRLIREADKATREAQARYERALEAAEQAGNDLVECASALWASLFPGELASQLPDVAAVATNLRRPVEDALQLKTRLPADGVFRVLRSDADFPRQGEPTGKVAHLWWYRCLVRAGLVPEGATSGMHMHRGRHGRDRAPARSPRPAPDAAPSRPR